MHPYAAARRVFRCRKGATALEFAIVSPILMCVLLVMVEFGLVFFAQSVLQGASGSVSRIGKTGYSASGITRETYLRNEVTRLSSGLLDSSKLTVTMKWYRGMQNIGQPEPCFVASCNASSLPSQYTDVNGNGRWDADQGTPGPGSGGVDTMYELSYPWPLFSSFMKSITGSSSLSVKAVAIVHNEEF